MADKLKILVLSLYYEPDLSAGSFRCTALVKELLAQNKVPCHVDVITSMPNRYTTYKAEAPLFEESANLSVRRIQMPEHSGNMGSQIRSYLKYYKEAFKITKNQNYDLVVATSGRLITASLAVRISRRANTALYLDIRDIFVDTLADVLSPLKFKLLNPILSLIERYTFKRATRVNLVSRGFEPYFQNKFPKLKYDYFTNGIDDEFIKIYEQNKLNPPAPTKNSKRRILYAGNIGEAQGLDIIIPPLAKLTEEEFDFHIIGDGGNKKELVDALQKQNIKNVTMIPPMSRVELIKNYQNADILFLHLNSHDAFKKVLPSKLFEYASFNKPILAGLEGFSAEFIKNNVENAEVFSPCSPSEAFDCLNKLNFDIPSRVDFVQKYSRRNIMKNMVSSILEIKE